MTPDTTVGRVFGIVGRVVVAGPARRLTPATLNRLDALFDVVLRVVDHGADQSAE
jgi:hypothetical protein